MTINLMKISMQSEAIMSSINCHLNVIKLVKAIQLVQSVLTFIGCEALGVIADRNSINVLI